jgi:uncharacterized OsmC-like protein
MSIGEAIAVAVRYLTEHPDEARYRDAPARATLEAGLAVSVTGPDGATLRTDMPTGIGGAGRAPSPGWFLRAAEASCVVSLVAIRAASLGIRLDSVAVDVDSESDDRGILGLDAAVPAGPLSTRIAVSVRGSGTDAELDELVRWAVDHCPVVDAVRRPVPVEVDIVVER